MILNVNDILKNIENIKKTDGSLALSATKEAILQFPDSQWLQIELIKIYKILNDYDNAKTACEALYKKYPLFIANWPLYINLNITDDLFETRLQEMLSRFFLDKISIQSEWQARLLVELSIITGSWESLNNREYFNQIENFNFNSNTIYNLIIFAARIKSDLNDLNENFDFYSICIADDVEALSVTDRTVYINIAALEVQNFNYFTDFNVNCLYLFLKIIFKNKTFLNEYGIRSLISKKLNLSKQRYLFFNLHSRIILNLSTQSEVSYSPLRGKELQLLDIQPGQLYVRVGSIELHAIATFLNNPTYAESVLNSVVPYLVKNQVDIIPFKARQRSWPRNDFLECLISLWTNAGWYDKSEAPADCFKQFVEEYLRGIESGYLFNTYLSELQLLSPHLNIEEKNIISWSTADFFRKINNKKILFVTPFASQINNSFQSGKLDCLYKDLGIDVSFDLICIEADITTYPNGDDDSWSETFSLMKSNVDNVLSSNINIEFFIASCGCYGIPIATHVNKLHSITSIYFGHVANYYFGIMTNAFKNYKLNNKDNSSKYWTQGDLSTRFKNIGIIDGGRYIS
jgi:hypothetical protein